MTDVDVSSFRPINGWVLVRVDTLRKNITESGVLYLPNEAREHLYQRATVVKTSDGWVKRELKSGHGHVYRRLPCPFTVGTRVLIPFFYAHKTFKRFREFIESDLVVPIKPEDVVLYDDPSGEGWGIDDVKIGPGGM